MPTALIPSFLLFCAVSAITPGPANLCSLAAAMAYGRRQALKQWRGIFVGYLIVSVLVSLMVWYLGMALKRYIRALTWIGEAYILWMSWNLLRSDSIGQARRNERCNFFTGLFVQLTNAKIILFCATALTTYALPYSDSYADVLKIALLLALLGGPVANLAWLFAGSSLQCFLQSRGKAVNMVMALVLAGCAVSIALN